MTTLKAMDINHIKQKRMCEKNVFTIHLSHTHTVTQTHTHTHKIRAQVTAGDWGKHSLQTTFVFI